MGEIMRMTILEKINEILRGSNSQDYRLGLINAIELAYNGNALIKFRYLTEAEVPQNELPGIDSTGKIVDKSRINFYYVK